MEAMETDLGGTGASGVDLRSSEADVGRVAPGVPPPLLLLRPRLLGGVPDPDEAELAPSIGAGAACLGSCGGARQRGETGRRARTGAVSSPTAGAGRACAGHKRWPQGETANGAWPVSTSSLCSAATEIVTLKRPTLTRCPMAIVAMSEAIARCVGARMIVSVHKGCEIGRAHV